MIDAVVAGVTAEGSGSKAPAPDAAAVAVAPHPRMVLPAIRDVTLIATIYLFFTGYCYRQFFLSDMGVPSGGEASLNTLMVDAFTVFLDNWWIPLLMLVGLVVLSVQRVRDVLDMEVVPLVATLAVIGFFGLDFAATRTAAHVAGALKDGTFPGGWPTVSLEFKKNVAFDDAAFAGAVSYPPSTENATASLVYATADTYYVMVRYATAGKRFNTTYAVPRADVHLLTQRFP